MHKLLNSLAAVAALALLSSAAQACDLHEAHVTASAPQVPETVAMSTHDGMPPVIIDQAATDQAAPTTECPDGGEDCTPSSQ